MPMHNAEKVGATVAAVAGIAYLANMLNSEEEIKENFWGVSVPFTVQPEYDTYCAPAKQQTRLTGSLPDSAFVKNVSYSPDNVISAANFSGDFENRGGARMQAAVDAVTFDGGKQARNVTMVGDHPQTLTQSRSHVTREGFANSEPHFQQVQPNAGGHDGRYVPRGGIMGAAPGEKVMESQLGGGIKEGIKTGHGVALPIGADAMMDVPADTFGMQGPNGPLSCFNTERLVYSTAKNRNYSAGDFIRGDIVPRAGNPFAQTTSPYNNIGTLNMGAFGIIGPGVQAVPEGGDQNTLTNQALYRANASGNTGNFMGKFTRDGGAGGAHVPQGKHNTYPGTGTFANKFPITQSKFDRINDIAEVNMPKVASNRAMAGGVTPNNRNAHVGRNVMRGDTQVTSSAFA